MSDESDQDMTYEMAKGLYQQIRRRGDRERVRINSNPRPVTPCRSAGVREALEREVVHERPNCDVVGPRGAERASTPEAESAFGVWPRRCALRAALDRVVGPFPPERGVVVGERRVSLMVYKDVGVDVVELGAAALPVVARRQALEEELGTRGK